MNHPSEQELTEFLYDEVDPAQRAQITSHIASCDACRERIDSWRDVRGALRTWSIPDRPHLSPRATPARFSHVLRYAIAATILLAVGFALARLTARDDSQLTRADPAVVDVLREELKRDLSVQLAALHREYREGLERRIRQIEAARLAEYEGLRQDVETVALRTQEEFLRLTAGGGASDSTQQSN